MALILAGRGFPPVCAVAVMAAPVGFGAGLAHHSALGRSCRRARTHLGVTYRRRQPELTDLYRVVQENLRTFLDLAAEADRRMPAHIEPEFDEYLRCGILAHGFARVHCRECQFDRLVAFSCRGRGWCPSCRDGG